MRHHHILNGDENRLQDLTDKVFGERPSGLSGLYCYFLGLSHNWMRENGIAGWLIPSEFMDVNYGKSVKRYLLEQVTLLRIHRFDPIEVQFKDALVSSVIVWFRKKKPPVGHAVEFTFGGNLKNPKMSKKVRSEVLRHELKWTRFPLADARKRPSGSTLGDFFSVKRGLATGDNNFFVLTSERIAALELPMNFFVPILPSPRFLKVQEVKCDSEGIPMLNPRLFLLDCRLTPDLIEARYPTLWNYFQNGKARGVPERFLCRHRAPWYVQEIRPPSPFICTYMGRGAANRDLPFRFILNHSRAVVTNSYLVLYPKPVLGMALRTDANLARRIWTTLNNIPLDSVLGEGRIYGGGTPQDRTKRTGKSACVWHRLPTIPNERFFQRATSFVPCGRRTIAPKIGGESRAL